MDYEHHVLRRNSHKDPITIEQFMIDDERITRAIHEERILRRTPTQISWSRKICSGDCDSTLFEIEAATLRGDTPVATLTEEGYSASETIRPRVILYSPALVRKIEPGTKAIQTRRTRTRNRATQTEAEAIPLYAPSSVKRIVHLIVLLAAISLVLARLATIPGEQASPLAATEHFPSSSAGLLRAIVAISLVIAVGRLLVSRAAAAIVTVPEHPEPTAAAATAFVAAIAAGYLLIQRPPRDAEEAAEVIDQEKRIDEQWVPFLRDIAGPEFADFKKGLINDCHCKTTLREAIIALYVRL